jgi:hypothetical protein
MTLEQAFENIAKLGLTHKQEIEMINLVGAFGRSEYSRGFRKSSELNDKYSN